MQWQSSHLYANPYKWLITRRSRITTMAETLFLSLCGEFNYLSVAQERKIRKTSSLTAPQPLSLVLERQTWHCCGKICISWGNGRSREWKGQGRIGGCILRTHMARPKHCKDGQTLVWWTEGTSRGWCFWNKQAPKHFCWHLSWFLQQLQKQL